jgi:hypothetical protein
MGESMFARLLLRYAAECPDTYIETIETIAPCRHPEKCAQEGRCIKLKARVQQMESEGANGKARPATIRD